MKSALNVDIFPFFVCRFFVFDTKFITSTNNKNAFWYRNIRRNEKKNWAIKIKLSHRNLKRKWHLVEREKKTKPVGQQKILILSLFGLLFESRTA